MVTPITPTDFGATAGLLRSEMRGGGHTTVDALRADHTRPHWVGLVQRTDEGVVGALIGRPLCRLISALVLPPRQRLALAPLWTCDGLEPPFHKWWDRR